MNFIGKRSELTLSSCESRFMGYVYMRRNIEITVNFEHGPPYINAHAQNIALSDRVRMLKLFPTSQSPEFLLPG